MLGKEKTSFTKQLRIRQQYFKGIILTNKAKSNRAPGTYEPLLIKDPTLVFLILQLMCEFLHSKKLKQ